MDPQTTTLTAQVTPTVLAQGTIILLIVLMVREMIWKGIALWKAGTQKRLARFVCLFIFNTAGILPILFLAFFQKKGKK